MTPIKSIILSALLLLIIISCNSKTPPETLDDARNVALYDKSSRLTEYLNTADEASALSLMDDKMQKAMQGNLNITWQSLIKLGGAFVEIGDYTGFKASGYDIIEMTLVFDKALFIQRTVFNTDNQISGLFFRPGKVETQNKNLPDNVTETAIKVDAKTGYPLDALLTEPEDNTHIAVVLVHGSGPSDKDETISANKPFLVLAHSLAEKGIAVLRYDKRTYAHSAKYAENPDIVKKLTIYDETIDDAVAAVKLMKERFPTVYLLGHSMGGGLLAEINTKGADCDGYIVMAGTPRKLFELSAEQNLLLADEMNTNGDLESAEQIQTMVQQELGKATRLSKLSDDDALKPENAIFAMSAWYLRSFEGIDTLKQHMSDGKPILILHGGRDRQVSMKDYELWQSGLLGHPNVTFKLYPTLNHLMGEYKGEEVPFSQLLTYEYGQGTPVADEVVNDIVEWVK